MSTVLHIDASARKEGSVSRDLTARIVERFKAGGVETVITRDLADAVPLIDEEWVGANFTPAEDRTDAQRDKLALSDRLVGELKAADVVVIGAPLYNFSVPAALKAWVDLVARAGSTFRYTENGPVGLLEGKRAIVVIPTGGTAVGSDVEFASGYLRHFLGFIGITDVEVIKADQLMMDADAALKSANDDVERLQTAA
ncbi:MAG: NAD(P)H-dependent oxidoreductase [Pseudomonadota bacterium]